MTGRESLLHRGFRYFGLDRLCAAIVGYARYRREVTKCFFKGPRLGHPWEGNALVRDCSGCPKRWVGNL